MTPVFDISMEEFYLLFNLASKILSMNVGAYKPSTISRDSSLIMDDICLKESIELLRDNGAVIIEDERCSGYIAAINDIVVYFVFTNGPLEQVKILATPKFLADTHINIYVRCADLKLLSDDSLFIKQQALVFMGIYKTFATMDHFADNLPLSAFYLMALIAGLYTDTPEHIVAALSEDTDTKDAILNGFYKIVNSEYYMINCKGYCSVNCDIDHECQFLGIMHHLINTCK